MKRMVAILMVFVLMIGVFAGCGKKEVKEGAEVRITAIAGPTGIGLVDLMQKSADAETVNT